VKEEILPTVDELFDRQLRLQSEAATVIMDLRLFDALRVGGVPNPVGSLATGLMVWRDIDFTVVCDRLDIGVVTGVAASFAAHPRVRSVEFRNDSGPWNSDESAYPDGLFLGIGYVGDAVWELDIWFVDEPDRQPDLHHVRELSDRLDDESRGAILTIKHAWHLRAEYGTTVSSHDIYRAVLDDGVTTIAGFDAWVRSRGV
jgi:hypothetical protein